MTWRNSSVIPYTWLLTLSIADRGREIIDVLASTPSVVEAWVVRSDADFKDADDDAVAVAGVEQEAGDDKEAEEGRGVS
ncbi:hypothetical protein LINGRAHAP2_LOCUS8643, partial [Linum grandiflorum]